MAKADRRQQRKQQKRKERLRQEKHVRRSAPKSRADERDPVAEFEAATITLAGEAQVWRLQRLGPDLQAELQSGREFQESDEQELMGRIAAALEASPQLQAQEQAYLVLEALEAGDALVDPAASERLALQTREALALDPANLDALALVATENVQTDAATSRGALVVALDAAEADLVDKDRTSAAAGQTIPDQTPLGWWGAIERRPLLRALDAAARLAADAGDLTEAESRYRRLIAHDPLGHFGQEPGLAAVLLALGDQTGLDHLRREIPDAWDGLLWPWIELLNDVGSGNRHGARARFLAQKASAPLFVAGLLGDEATINAHADDADAEEAGWGESLLRRLTPVLAKHPDLLTWLRDGAPV